MSTRRATGRRHRQVPTAALALFAAVAGLGLVASGAAMAEPGGGSVVGGAGSIGSAGNTTMIDQQTSRLIIDWDSFNIDANEIVKFTQPGRQAVALNRVLDNLPSQIRGQLLANGNVWIVNRHGVTIHASAEIDVGGLLVTTSDIANDDFMAGNDRFSIPGEEGARVVNRGTITFADAGLAGLVAPGVANTGTIVGKVGSVVVAGRETFAVDLAGDGLMAFQMDPAQSATEAVNTGTIRNEGGYILITAAQADALVSGSVNVGGSLDASSDTGTGGTVEIYGRDVTVASGAAVRADGATGGGTVLIGGDKRGAGTDHAFRADTLRVEDGASLTADATRDGDGGFIETSAREIMLAPRLSTLGAGPDGVHGEWLIDPENVTISDAPTAFGNVNIAQLENTLAGGNITVETDETADPGGDSLPPAGGPGGEVGNIRVADPLLIPHARTTLTLDADNAIIIDAALRTAGGLNLMAAGADAGVGVALNADVSVGGDFTIAAAAGGVNGAGSRVTANRLFRIDAAGPVSIADVAAANLTIATTDGGIMQQPDSTISVTGATDLTAGGRGAAITLVGAGDNEFGGDLRLTAPDDILVAADSVGGSVVLRETAGGAGGSRTFASIGSVGGALTIDAAEGDADLLVAGAIAGDVTVSAANGDARVGVGLVDDGTVDVTWRHGSVTAHGATGMGDVSIADLQVGPANLDGAPPGSDPRDVAVAGTFRNINLAVAADFGVVLGGGIDIAASEPAAVEGRAFAERALSVDRGQDAMDGDHGNLTVIADRGSFAVDPAGLRFLGDREGSQGAGRDILQAGPVTVAGNATLDANSVSDVILEAAGNNFGSHHDDPAGNQALPIGRVHVRGENVRISDATDIHLGAVAAERLEVSTADDGSVFFRQVLGLDRSETRVIRDGSTVGGEGAVGDVVLSSGDDVVIGVLGDPADPGGPNFDPLLSAPGEAGFRQDIFFVDSLTVDRAPGRIILPQTAATRAHFEQSLRYFGVNIAEAFRYAGPHEEIDLTGFLVAARDRDAGLLPQGPRGADYRFNDCVIGDTNTCTALLAPVEVRTRITRPEDLFDLQRNRLDYVYVPIGNEELWGVPAGLLYGRGRAILNPTEDVEERKRAPE